MNRWRGRSEQVVRDGRPVVGVVDVRRAGSAAGDEQPPVLLVVLEAGRGTSGRRLDEREALPGLGVDLAHRALGNRAHVQRVLVSPLRCPPAASRREAGSRPGSCSLPRHRGDDQRAGAHDGGQAGSCHSPLLLWSGFTPHLPVRAPSRNGWVLSMSACRSSQPGLWWWEAAHPEWTPEHDAAGSTGGPTSRPTRSTTASGYCSSTRRSAEPGRRACRRPRDGHRADVSVACPRRTDARQTSRRYALRAGTDEGEPNPLPARLFSAGETLPVGVRRSPGMEPNDLVLWIESHRAVVAGDTLIDRGTGLEFPRDWASRGAVLERGVPPDQILAVTAAVARAAGRAVLPTHGPPGDRASLERALA